MKGSFARCAPVVPGGASAPPLHNDEIAGPARRGMVPTRRPHQETHGSIVERDEMSRTCSAFEISAAGRDASPCQNKMGVYTPIVKIGPRFAGTTETQKRSESGSAFEISAAGHDAPPCQNKIGAYTPIVKIGPRFAGTTERACETAQVATAGNADAV
jgi:hypothetical protein